ncbi:MAG TPA: hypothetical protein VLF88_01125 [Candidatus Babeliales bacterium]|nr:hypothetical protein [Candidatus Babeliales bacterium]
MSRFKRLSFCLALLFLFSILAIAVPVSAQNTNDDTVNNPTVSGHGSGHDLAEQFKLQAKEKVQVARQSAQEHTQAQRQKSCEARKSSLEKRMTNAVAHAKKHKAVFDKMFTRVQNFYTTKKLNVTDYDSHKANVVTAQTNAQASIDALAALDVNVDCSSQNVADSVSAFQQAVKTSRDSLKAYRTTLVDLINSLKGASTSTDKTSETSQ